MPMESIGMYEGYTHMANMFLTQTTADIQEKIWEILEQEEECEGGVTRLEEGDLAVRIFGKRGQALLEVNEKIKKLFQISLIGIG